MIETIIEILPILIPLVLIDWVFGFTASSIYISLIVRRCL